MTDYQAFLKSKAHPDDLYGIEPNWLPDCLFPFQNVITDWNIRKGRAASFQACGLGKGHPDGTRILTPSGWEVIENLKVGREVVGSDGTPCTVTGVYNRGQQPIYEVFFDDDTSILVDENHLWPVKNPSDKARNKPYRIMSTGDLLKTKLKYGTTGQSRTWTIPTVQPVEFPEQDLPLDPYILGVLLGDGNLAAGPRWNKPDEFIADKVRARLPEGCEVSKCVDNNWGIVTRPKGADNPIRNWLRSVGLTGGSDEEFVPDQYLFASYKQRLQLLRGLMDTDGYAGESPEFSSASRRLAEAVVFLTQSFGGTASLKIKEFPTYQYNGETRIGKPSYRVVLSLKGPNPFSLPRKKSLWKSPSRGTGRWIDRIESKGIANSTCISVNSGDNLYVVDHFIVTHNTVQEIVYGENIHRHTNKPVLILCPLAVAPQIVREGEKFGVKIHPTRKGAVKNGLNVTNYERLGYFNPTDFICIIGDECFPAGTPVDVLNIDGTPGVRYIEDIRPGDRILNASGVDHVVACKKRPVNRAVRVSSGGFDISCSENHPFLTVHGWRFARDLRAGDYLVATETAMCLVRGDIPASLLVPEDAEVLREILLSEMADEYRGTQTESTHTGGCSEKGKKQIGMVQIGRSCCRKGKGSNVCFESSDQSRACKKDEGDEGKKRNTSCLEGKERRQRNGIDCTRTDIGGCSWRAVGTLCSTHPGESQFRIPNSLQDRCGSRGTEDWNRGGRILSQSEKRSGREEGQKTPVVRVDNIEILEQGHPELERLRDADGSLCFYDLEAAWHPSFSVGGLLVHNSGILKSFDGKMRRQITDAVQKVPYRLLATATPAPNDYMELGTHSEALGAMGRNQMLGMFFSNGGDDTQQWTLKGHARKRFWRWICTWARAVRKPSDLGFPDGDFILPELKVHQHVVKSSRAKLGFGLVGAKTLDQQRAERRATIKERCHKVVELLPKDDYCIIWVHMNSEGDLLEKLIPGSVQVAGSDKDTVKEERLTAFAKGEIKTLITKPKIGAWGLNLQHCANMISFISHSWESHHQSIRRCWRFGQKRKVTVDLVTSEGESRVMSNMQRKERQSEAMFENLVAELKYFQNPTLVKEENKVCPLPPWLLKRD